MTVAPAASSCGVMLLVLVVGLAWFWQWRTYPTVFPGDGNGESMTLSKGQEMVAFGVTYPYPGDGEAVTVHSAEPRIVENSADATFEFYGLWSRKAWT